MGWYHLSYLLPRIVLGIREINVSALSTVTPISMLCTGRLRKSPVCVVSVQFSSELQLQSEVLPDKNSYRLLSTFYVPGTELNASQALFYFILMVTLLVWHSYGFSSQKCWVPNPSWSSRKPVSCPLSCFLSEGASFSILTFFKWFKIVSSVESFFNVWVYYQARTHGMQLWSLNRDRDRDRDRERHRKTRETRGWGDKERQKMYDREKNIFVFDTNSDFLIFYVQIILKSIIN